MKKTIQKLFISILSLILALSLVGTVAYAWFSIATTNVAHNLTLGISADDSFEISLDGLNYSNVIENSEIMKFIGENFKLHDVTSNDGLNFFKGGPVKYENAVENIDYLSIPIYFRTTAKATANPSTVLRNVFLVDNVSEEAYLDKDVDGTYVVSKGINWRADSTFINGEDSVNDVIYAGERHVVYGAEAIRLGFVERKNLQNNLDDRNDGELANKIFDLSRDPIRGYGTSYGSLDYYNVKHDSNIEPPTTEQNVITRLSTFNEFDPRIPNDYNSLIATMTKTNEFDQNGDVYYVGFVQMNIWLEGWDADCFDAIQTDKVIIRLKFRIARDLINTIYT